jgi:hypothetical protein
MIDVNKKILRGKPGPLQFSAPLPLSAPPEPSAVDRLAAKVDPKVAERVAFQELAREIWEESLR